MKELIWKDITGYDRYNKLRTPTTFKASIGDLRICVFFHLSPLLNRP
jgi:hypothetical protein